MGKLKNCPDCGASVSRKALACPSCGRPLKRKPKQYGCISTIVVVAFIAFVVSMLMPKGPRQPGASPNPGPSRTAPSLLPGVAAFLKSHPEYGGPRASQDMPDWARGKRQRVDFDSGRSLLFYEEGGDVVTVYEDSPTAGRTKIWGQ